MNRRNESIDLEPCRTFIILLALCSTDDINQYHYFLLLKDCKLQFDFPFKKKTINFLLLTNTFPVEMATFRNMKKLAALNKENCEEHPRSNLAQNSNVPRSQEDYITQVSEEIEGRVTKKLSQEFSRTENRILGALPRLDDFLMNPLIQGYSGSAPETSRNAFSTNQGTNEDDSQIPKQASSTTRRRESLAQKKATTTTCPQKMKAY